MHGTNIVISLFLYFYCQVKEKLGYTPWRKNCSLTNTCINLASNALGFITSSVKLNNIKCIKKFLTALSYLKYATEVWNSCYKIYKSRLDTIQCKFLSFLDYETKLFASVYEQKCIFMHHLLSLLISRDISFVI